MKFRVTFKDPDTLDDAINDAVTKEVETLNLPPDEAEGVWKIRTEKVKTASRKWFEYGEYVSIDVDTDAGTATVVSKS